MRATFSRITLANFAAAMLFLPMSASAQVLSMDGQRDPLVIFGPNGSPIYYFRAGLKTRHAIESPRVAEAKWGPDWRTSVFLCNDPRANRAQCDLLESFRVGASIRMDTCLNGTFDLNEEPGCIPPGYR